LFKTVRDETTLTLKLINKEVDLSLIDFSPRKLNWLKKNKKDLKLNFWEQESSNYKYIGINHNNKHLRNKFVRKALSHLIQREGLLKYKLANSAVLSRGLFSHAFKPSLSGQAIDSFDPDLANKLLEKAGYKKGLNGYYHKGGDEIKLRWRISNNKNTYELVKTIQNSLMENGIRVFVVRNEWGAYYRAFKRGDFDLVLGSWIGFTGPDFFHSLFHSKSLPPKGRNRGRYESEKMDKLLDNAMSLVGNEERRIAFEKVQKLANDDYIYLNLWHPKVLWVGRNCIEKIKIFPNGSFYPLLKIRNLCDLEAKWKKKRTQNYQ
jgi:peptide/nickel transport system substrate-binding protein